MPLPEDTLRNISDREFTLWKYYEDRADRLGERLWSIGIWFLTILGGLAALPFAAGFLKPSAKFIPLDIESPILVAMLAVFGMLLCLYAFLALSDIREHIITNWGRSNLILNSPNAARERPAPITDDEERKFTAWEGRRNHSWKILLVVGGAAFACSGGIFILTIVRSLGHF